MLASCSRAVSDAVFGLDISCTLASDYSFFVIKQAPTPEEINRLCSSPECSQVIVTIRKAVPNECVIETMYQGGLALYKDILNPIASVCSKGPVVAPAPPPSLMPSMSVTCANQVSDAVFTVGPKCHSDSGYSFFVITDKPSPETITRICASKNCAETVAAIKKAVPNECAMRGFGNKGINLYADILQPIDSACNGHSASSQGSTAHDASATALTTAPPSAPNSSATAMVPAPSTTKSSAPTRRCAVVSAVVFALEPVTRRAATGHADNHSCLRGAPQEETSGPLSVVPNWTLQRKASRAPLPQAAAMPVCDYNRIMDAIKAVLNQEMSCSQVSGYSFWGLHEAPSAESIPKICANANCQTVIQAIKAVQPTECNTGGPMYNYYVYGQILDPIKDGCAKTAPPTTAPTTTAPPTTAPPTTAPPTTPPPTTTTPPTTFSPSTSTPETSTTNQTTSTQAPVVNDNSSAAAANNGAAKASSGLNSTLIIAIVAGVVLVVALVAFLAFSAGKEKKKKRHQTPREASYVVQNDKDNRAAAARRQAQAYPPSAPSPVTTASSATRSSAPATSSSAFARSPVPVLDGGAAEMSATGPWNESAIKKARIPLDEINVGDLLSAGAFGEVLRGSYNGEPVAIKRLLPARRKDMKEIESFFDEAKLLTSLRHQRIVQFVGVAWDSLTDLCIVTEFMDGGDLRSLLQHADANNEPTGFDANKVKIALHIIHALSYLHGLKPIVVHRDLKSKNVLLTRDLDAKLTDFGVSREQAEKTMTAGVGSSLWMAPEVMLGERYDEKADIFSFGVMLSELDTQKLPYAHAKEPGSDRQVPELAILNMVSAGRLSVVFTEGADPDMVSTAQACVAMGPKDRPSAKDLLSRLHHIYRGYRDI